MLRKILFFPLTRMFIAIIAIVSVVVLESMLLPTNRRGVRVSGQTAFRVLSGAIVIVSVCLVYAGYVRIFERRRDRGIIEETGPA